MSSGQNYEATEIARKMSENNIGNVIGQYKKLWRSTRKISDIKSVSLALFST